MDLNEFVAKIAEQYDENDDVEFTPATRFKEIEEYSSLTALTIIAMADDECHVVLKGDDIRQSTTIEDLYNVVKSRM